MSVNVAGLIESLKREVNPPGQDLYPDARDEEWLGNLQDAFWEARLNGLLAGFTESNGTITPLSGTDDLGRELQQLIVLWAGYRITLAKLDALRTAFRVSAPGPVSYEVEQSATVARERLAAIKDRLKPVITELKASGNKGALVLDAVIQRTYGELSGEQWWVR